jgi:hypothetical protein
MPVMIATQFKLKCPLCAESITLPRAGDLGNYAGETYHPSPESWPIKWICTAHEQICECSTDRIERINFEEQPYVTHPATVWKIEQRCSRGDCVEQFQGFTLWDASESCRGTLIDRVDKTKPKATCAANHEILWQADRLRATMVPF